MIEKVAPPPLPTAVMSCHKSEMFELSVLDFRKDSSVRSLDLRGSGDGMESDANELCHYCLVRVDRSGNIERIVTDAEAEDILCNSEEGKPMNQATVPQRCDNLKQTVHTSLSGKARAQQQKKTGNTPNTPLKIPQRSMSQYKPGGPCDHCGVTESPQWRKGPTNKPQLCNACGTRYRRTSQLDRQTPNNRSPVSSKSQSIPRKRSSPTSSPTGKQLSKKSKQQFDQCVKQHQHLQNLPISSMTASPVIDVNVNMSHATAVQG